MLCIITYLYMYRVSMHVSSLVSYILSFRVSVVYIILFGCCYSNAWLRSLLLRSLSSEALERTRTLISIVLIFLLFSSSLSFNTLINTYSLKDLSLINGVRLNHNNLTECEN